jgi:hypothetical protein
MIFSGKTRIHPRIKSEGRPFPRYALKAKRNHEKKNPATSSIQICTWVSNNETSAISHCAMTLPPKIWRTPAPLLEIIRACQATAVIESTIAPAILGRARSRCCMPVGRRAQPLCSTPTGHPVALARWEHDLFGKPAATLGSSPRAGFSGSSSRPAAGGAVRGTRRGIRSSWRAAQKTRAACRSRPRRSVPARPSAVRRSR